MQVHPRRLGGADGVGAPTGSKFHTQGAQESCHPENGWRPQKGRPACQEGLPYPPPLELGLSEAGAL